MAAPLSGPIDIRPDRLTDLDGLEVSWADLALLLTVDAEAWKLEAEYIPEHFQTFHRHLPTRLRELHEELIERLG